MDSVQVSFDCCTLKNSRHWHSCNKKPDKCKQADALSCCALSSEFLLAVESAQSCLPPVLIFFTLCLTRSCGCITMLSAWPSLILESSCCPLGNTGLLNRCQRRADQRSEFIAVDADDRKIIRNTEAAVNRISDKFKSKSIGKCQKRCRSFF